MKATVMYGAGDVFDRTGSLDDVPEGYRLMNERESIKFLIDL